MRARAPYFRYELFASSLSPHDFLRHCNEHIGITGALVLWWCSVRNTLYCIRTQLVGLLSQRPFGRHISSPGSLWNKDIESVLSTIE
ncbi:hypothetical protein H9L39_09150 [Fusarium oxysporum f. sp. albedinis]|nr:hypothetical protein H9L39_09150 [Fusarium oxysporum f. sp. albedinis]